MSSVADIVGRLLAGFDWFVLVYFFALNTTSLGLIIVAARQTSRALRRASLTGNDDIFANPLTPPISVIVPVHNDESNIVDIVRSLIGLRYPSFEVVVVDDGSTDGTFDLLSSAFDLMEVAPAVDEDVALLGPMSSLHAARSGVPVVVVRKVHAGNRADALNAGVNVARHPLVCCLDTDSVLEPVALLSVAKPFVDDPERVVATGGAVRTANGSTVYRGQVISMQQPSGWLARFQSLEYLRSFLVSRTGWARFGLLIMISGGFGVYRRDALLDVGGFDPESVDPDADLLCSLHRYRRDRGTDYRIVFVPETVCWTEVPETRQSLAAQRMRWSYGLSQVLWKHRRMMFNPKYGRIGLVSMPHYLVFELVAPVMELVGLAAVLAGLYFGVIGLDFFVLLSVVVVLYGLAVSIASLLVEELTFHRYTRWRDLAAGLAASLLEHVGYRQLHAWWRVRGLAMAARKQPPVGPCVPGAIIDAEPA